ncbi:MAG: UDP-N-acetylmuramate--L-alanine ligase [Chloroflexota bacterium]
MTHYHLIGIGGTGLSAIARVLLEMGHTVTGSDRAASPFTRDLESAGVTVSLGHRPENLVGAEIVVRSSAIPNDNPEVIAARAVGIPVYKRVDFLGSLMEGKTGIAVAGTHGKTTTTSMLAWVFTALHQDPTFISGGVLANLGVNAHAGKGAAFIIEADEYDRMFLGLKPAIEIVTNVEHDHPDCYPAPADFQAAFVDFVHLLPTDGTLIACAEDDGARRLLQEAEGLGRAALSYGLRPMTEDGALEVDTFAEVLTLNERGGFTVGARVVGDGVTVSLQVPGHHNVRNALAVLTVVHLLGLDLAKAAQALADFQGTGRRFEVRGEAGGVTVIDDYAHHPTEIRATLAAARLRYPGRRLWAVWQPHTYSRTQALFDEFTRAFGDADEVLVTEIYASREAKQDFSSRQVVEAMSHPAAHFSGELEETCRTLVSKLRPGDVLLVLSAGDADTVSETVLGALQERAA